MQMHAYTSLQVDMSTDSDVSPGTRVGYYPVMPHHRLPLRRFTSIWQNTVQKTSTSSSCLSQGQKHEYEQRQNQVLNRPVLTTLRRIDRFTGGFPAATISLLESQHEFVFNMLARIIVHTVKTSEHDVVYVDGGNTLDPYLLTAASRLFRLDPEHVLRRVQVARAFTVYQLDTLITQKLEHILNRCRPKLVMVSCMSELYLDHDVDWHEARVLFESNFERLTELTNEYNITTILTNLGRDKSIHRYELGRKLRKWLPPENRLSIKRPGRNRLRFVKGTGEFLDYLPLPPYQWSLDDFYEGLVGHARNVGHSAHVRGDVCG